MTSAPVATVALSQAYAFRAHPQSSNASIGAKLPIILPLSVVGPKRAKHFILSSPRTLPNGAVSPAHFTEFLAEPVNPARSSCGGVLRPLKAVMAAVQQHPEDIVVSAVERTPIEVWLHIADLIACLDRPMPGDPSYSYLDIEDSIARRRNAIGILAGLRLVSRWWDKVALPLLASWIILEGKRPKGLIDFLTAAYRRNMSQKKGCLVQRLEITAEKLRPHPRYQPDTPGWIPWAAYVTEILDYCTELREFILYDDPHAGPSLLDDLLPALHEKRASLTTILIPNSSCRLAEALDRFSSARTLHCHVAGNEQELFSLAARNSPLPLKTLSLTVPATSLEWADFLSRARLPVLSTLSLDFSTDDPLVLSHVLPKMRPMFLAWGSQLRCLQVTCTPNNVFSKVHDGALLFFSLKYCPMVEILHVEFGMNRHATASSAFLRIIHCTGFFRDPLSIRRGAAPFEAAEHVKDVCDMITELCCNSFPALELIRCTDVVSSLPEDMLPPTRSPFWSWMEVYQDLAETTAAICAEMGGKLRFEGADRVVISRVCLPRFWTQRSIPCEALAYAGWPSHVAPSDGSVQLL